MQWVDKLKESLPEYAKDIKLNLDAVINRGSFDPEYASALALAASMQTGNAKLTQFIASDIVNEVEKNAAMTAGSLMAQNNIWYPYLEMLEDSNVKGLPAQLRMNAIANHGGTTKDKFEAYALIASIIGKCHFCVNGHAETLKSEGYSSEQLRDLGRIAAVVNALSKVLSA
jgi:alkyl hydroperoxide reductase subunit D